MTAHDPPLSDSLAEGDRYPEEDMERVGVDDWRACGVYALRLCRPLSQDQMLEDWFDHYDASPPEELYAARQSKSVFYVGASKDVLGRVHEHLENPNRSGAIMRVMPIHSIAEVWPEPNPSLAFERESRRAIEYRQAGENRFVWQR